jgi:hypothetical protein
VAKRKMKSVDFVLLELWQTESFLCRIFAYFLLIDCFTFPPLLWSFHLLVFG